MILYLVPRSEPARRAGMIGMLGEYILEEQETVGLRRNEWGFHTG